MLIYDMCTYRTFSPWHLPLAIFRPRDWQMSHLTPDTWPRMIEFSHTTSVRSTYLEKNDSQFYTTSDRLKSCVALCLQKTTSTIQRAPFYRADKFRNSKWSRCASLHIPIQTQIRSWVCVNLFAYTIYRVTNPFTVIFHRNSFHNKACYQNSYRAWLNFQS